MKPEEKRSAIWMLLMENGGGRLWSKTQQDVALKFLEVLIDARKSGIDASEVRQIIKLAKG